MHIQVKRQDLNQSVNIVLKAVTSKTTNPILEGIFIAASNGALTMYSTDLEMSIHTTCPCTVKEEGEVVIPGRIFTEVIRKMGGEELTITSDENNRIQIRSLESDITINGQSAEHFPSIPVSQSTDYIIIDSEKLKRLIKETIFAASIEDNMPVLTGVLIEIDEESFQCTALDGYRMAIRKETIENGVNFSCIVPSRVLNEIYKILSIDSSDTMIRYAGNKVHFIINETEVIANLIDGNYINYNDIIPKASNLTVKAKSIDLLNACDRASLVAREGKNNLIKMHILGDNFHILSKSEIGSVDERVECEKVGGEIKISFNSKYFIDVLKNIQDEEVNIDFIDNKSPCVLKAVDNDCILQVILPVRYKED